jgi:hypothetical protein
MFREQAVIQTFGEDAPSVFAVMTAAGALLAPGLVSLGMFLYRVLGLGWGSPILAFALLLINAHAAWQIPEDTFAPVPPT